MINQVRRRLLTAESNDASSLGGTEEVVMSEVSRRALLRWATATSFVSKLLRAHQDSQPQDAHQPDETTFTAGVNVVNIFATVRDKRGEIVKELTKDDFAILENSRPQVIKYFTRDTDLPLTVGLLIDTSMSQDKLLNAERGACFRFLDQVLRERKDQFFLAQFDLGVVMRQELTASRSQLNEALSYVDTPSRNQLMAQGGGGGTVLYDALVKVSNEEMAGQKNRKAIIVLSDGVDFGSNATLSEGIEAVQMADTIVYSILFADPHAYAGGGEAQRGREAMMRMARETGGAFFEVTKKLNIEQTFDAIQTDLRSQYSLGYTPNPPVKEPQFRKIQVTVKRDDVIVEARNRYYARP